MHDREEILTACTSLGYEHDCAPSVRRAQYAEL